MTAETLIRAGLTMAPASYLDASLGVRQAVANGCGPRRWPAWLRSPLSKLFGQSIRPACDIHDWMYARGDGWRYKLRADWVLLINVLALIWGAGGGGVVKLLRSLAALFYFLSVLLFGWGAYNGGR